MLTSADQSASAARCRETGVRTHIIKPIKPAELLLAIRQALGKAANDAAPAGAAEWDHIPIVAMTAHATGGDRDRCLDSGMDDYVSKPVSRRMLAEAIERVCGAGAETVPKA